MKQIRLPLIITAVLVLVGACTQSAMGCEGQGACMLYFYADDWKVCQQMEPIVNGLEDKYGDAFAIVRVNVGKPDGKQLAREQGCIGTPAFVLFNESEEPTRRLQGAHTSTTFEMEIERILAE